MGKIHQLKTKARPAGTTSTPTSFVGPQFPGSELIRLLAEKADADDLTAYELAERLGMTYAYLLMLSRGPKHREHRKVQDLSMPQLKRMANFLERPLMDILVLAELVKPEDQYVAVDLEQRVDSVWRRWLEDPVWGRLAPLSAGWKKTPFADRVRMAALYDHLAHRQRILPEPHLIRFSQPKTASRRSAAPVRAKKVANAR